MFWFQILSEEYFDYFNLFSAAWLQLHAKHMIVTQLTLFTTDKLHAKLQKI